MDIGTESRQETGERGKLAGIELVANIQSCGMALDFQDSQVKGFHISRTAESESFNVD